MHRSTWGVGGWPFVLWRQRGLIAQLVARELKQRYRGSYLGTFWSLLTPVLMLLVYTFVFSIVLEGRWGRGDAALARGEFALTLFAGLIPFNVFAEVVNRAPTLVLNVPNYVKKVVFPLEVLPVVAVGSAVVQSLLSLLVLLAGIVILRGWLSPALVYLPFAYLPLILLCLGLGWFLASLGVYIRDLGHAIGIAVQVLFFLSPVFYPITAVPEQLRPFLYANPIATVLSAFRRTLLWATPPPWGPWAGVTAGALVLSVLGYLWFEKTRRGFADVL